MGDQLVLLHAYAQFCIHLRMHGQIWKVCTCVLLSSVLQLQSPRKGADFAPHAPSSENYIEVSTIFRDSEIKLTGKIYYFDTTISNWNL